MIIRLRTMKVGTNEERYILIICPCFYIIIIIIKQNMDIESNVWKIKLETWKQVRMWCIN